MLDASGRAVRLYVGDYEAGSSPIADTDPTTSLGATFRIVPGAYRFTAVGSDDTLLVKLRERSDAYESVAAGGVALKITRLPDDPRLKPLTELQRGRLVAQGRLAASRNRNRPRRLRRMAS